MKNIILLPLDERPCNFDFPSKIFNGEKYTIIRPEHLGQKKTPASYEFIRDFLLANIEKADAAVISIDTLDRLCNGRNGLQGCSLRRM